jgi:hypothetical protein
MNEEEKKQEAKRSISYFWEEKGTLDFGSSEEYLNMFPEIKFAYSQLKMIEKSITKMVEDLYKEDN